MKVVALVFILCLVLPGLCKELRIPCYGEVYYTCKDFCRRNCAQTRNVCLRECNRGCGCTEALIVLDDGGCMPLQKCEPKNK